MFFTTVIAVLTVFSSCEKINYTKNISDVTSAESESQNTRTPQKTVYVENEIKDYPIISQKVNEIFELEDVFEILEKYTDGEYSGTSYVKLKGKKKFEITVPASRHYTLVLSLKSEGAKSINCTANGKYVGTWYASKSDVFFDYAINNIYLESGKNEIILELPEKYLDLTTKEGISADFFQIKGGGAVSPVRFDVSLRLANSSSNDTANEIFTWLIDGYGERIITGVACTGGTNAELDAVYKVTGRYPSIRYGDLSKYSRTYALTDKIDYKDIELAIDFAAKGGLIGYKWSWYPPNGDTSYLAAKTNFNLDIAVTEKEIYYYSMSELTIMKEDGEITSECYDIMRDIDDMAAHLQTLNEKNITVLFEPLYQAGLKRYWWGNCAPAAEIWLWQTMFKRFSEYYDLGNLIWVWSGADKQYYPGDEFVDIIGEGIYSDFEISNVGRFNMTLSYPKRFRAAAATETSFFPNPDIMFRDGTLWLFAVTAEGGSVILPDGSFNGDIEKKNSYVYAFNHRLTVTLDELPEFNQSSRRNDDNGIYN